MLQTHIIDGRLRHSLLLEIFTDTGIGTEIIRSERTDPGRRHRPGPDSVKYIGPASEMRAELLFAVEKKGSR